MQGQITDKSAVDALADRRPTRRLLLATTSTALLWSVITPALAGDCPPIVLTGDTTGEEDSCQSEDYPGRDQQFVVDIPCAGTWTFMVDAEWDWWLYVGNEECEIANEDWIVNGQILTITIPAGQYHVTVDSEFNFEFGPFVLNIFLPSADYRVTDLGQLPSAWDIGQHGSFGINNQGQVAFSALRGNDLTAYLWDASARTALPFGGYAPPSIARDINEAGQLVGQVGGTRTAEGQGVVWTPTQPPGNYTVSVIPPFGATICPWSRAHAINDDVPNPIVVGESDALARCYGPCLANEGDRTSVIRGFAVSLGSSPAPLAAGGDFFCFLSTYAHDVSDTPQLGSATIAGFADKGQTDCEGPVCAEGGDRRAAAWIDPAGAMAMIHLNDLGSEALAVNNTGQLAGWGHTPPGGEENKTSLFWNSMTASPVNLGAILPDGQHATDDSRADGISNAVSDTVYVVGANTFREAALSWHRDALGEWSVTNLNEVTTCRDVEIRHAHAVNDTAAIVATGFDLSVNEHHVYLLTPIIEGTCGADVNGNGAVDFADIIVLLGAWGDRCGVGESCTVDINFDCVVDFADILVVLTEWGPCPGGAAPDSVKTVIEEMGLEYPADWHQFMDRMANGTAIEQDDHRCWLEHYYYAHYLQVCLCSPTCPQDDPWTGTHF